jgi:hypothetical protein
MIMTKKTVEKQRILLVEPNYKNKYPPIGLMKISSYFKSKGFYVQFHKGLLPTNEIKTFDFAFITTMFTFDFNMCIDTIKYYASVLGLEKVYAGGIAVTIMPEKFSEAIPGIKLLPGRLTNSSVLNFSDNVNIDALELDYDMLLDIPYEYPMADSYFIHTTRGCPRKCSFCAVKTLEPEFFDCDNIIAQIQAVNRKYGIKRNLLIMDNNILYSDNLAKLVEEMCSLGYEKNNNRVTRANPMRWYINSLQTRINEEHTYKYLLVRIKEILNGLNFKRIKNEDCTLLQNLVTLSKSDNESTFIDALLKNKDDLISILDSYYHHKITRYVDFNQGLDARLFTDEKASLLSRLALKPCRIAFDDISTKKNYLNALNLCLKHDILYFSNYLLYNYKDTPVDLWERLKLNIDFCEAHPNVSLFSFPMKYASIQHTNRNYIGEHWCKKFLRGFNIILNVTNGVVARESDFFVRAYGKTSTEFIEILSMPDEFIRFRDFFDANGLSNKWRLQYLALSEEEKKMLLQILSSCNDINEITSTTSSNLKINTILSFYKIRKKDIEKQNKFL